MSTAPAYPAIEARAVRRVYQAKPADVIALDGIELTVAPGEFFAAHVVDRRRARGARARRGQLRRRSRLPV